MTMMIIKEMFNLIIMLIMIIKKMFNLIKMLIMIIKDMFNLIKMLMINMITMIMTIVITSSDARWLPMGADGVGALEAEMTRVAGNTNIIIMAIINSSSILIINYLSSPLSP